MATKAKESSTLVVTEHRRGGYHAIFGREQFNQLRFCIGALIVYLQIERVYNCPGVAGAQNVSCSVLGVEGAVEFKSLCAFVNKIC